MLVGQFTIQQKLPSLNEVIQANRRNAFVGARLKSDLQNQIGMYILVARNKEQIKAIDEPIEILIEWHERTLKRDVDNITSATKFILDSMQDMGIIPNDNRRYVKQVYSKVIDDKEDFVVVKIYSVGSLAIQINDGEIQNGKDKNN